MTLTKKWVWVRQMYSFSPPLEKLLIAGSMHDASKALGHFGAMKKSFIFFLINIFFEFSIHALDCKQIITEKQAEKAVQEYRNKQPNVAGRFDNLKVHFERESFGCHFNYIEIKVPEEAHARIIFRLNDRADVVDVATHTPLRQNSLTCPKMNLKLDFFSKEVDRLRNTEKDSLIPLKGDRNKESLNLMRCVYVFEEYSSARKNSWESNAFYFDFNGELIYFSPKASVVDKSVK